MSMPMQSLSPDPFDTMSLTLTDDDFIGNLEDLVGATTLAVDFHDLYAEAQQLCSEAHGAFVRSVEDETRDLVVRSAAAQQTLVDQMRACISSAVRSSAAAGMRSATLLAFHGGDLHEGLSFLHLFLGPKDAARRRQLAVHGFEPLAPRLRRELAPFKVVHRWDQATNLNTVALEWPPTPAAAAAAAV